MPEPRISQSLVVPPEYISAVWHIVANTSLHASWVRVLGRALAGDASKLVASLPG